MSAFLPDPNADGWRPEGDGEEFVCDVLRMGGLPVAVVQAWASDGPFYGNALTPDGSWVRRGAGGTLAGTVAWCEERSGYRVRRPGNASERVRNAP